MVSQAPAPLPDIQPESPRLDIERLNSLAWKLRIGQKEQAYELCSRAADLARAGDLTLDTYRRGLSASLATMALINADCGRPELAIRQCMEAQSLLNGLSGDPALSDLWIAMSWIHIYLGSYPAALDYAIQALDLARELKDLHREAWALDAVASTYGASGDADISIQMHNQAAALFSQVEDMEGQARTLNNLACTLLESGQLEHALECGRKGLQLARQRGMKSEVVIFAGTVGDILIAQGDFRQAEKYLRLGLVESNVSRGASNQLVSIYQQIVLGRLFLAGERLDEAETCVKAALTLAQASEMADSQSQCHQLLSEVAERRHDMATALEHYKEFHRLREVTAGEETARRLAILKVTHQSESAMRNAEIYRLHNIELQREIEERKRAESQLHTMAMLDPLTNLYNRRQFYSLAKLEIERAKAGGHSLSVLMLDLDHFKRINDLFGHLAGDTVLVTVAQLIQRGLREHDIVARYGGEEFVALLPETTADEAYEISERIRRAVDELEFETSAGPIRVTISIGVTNLTAARLQTGSELDLLLNRADQALYYAKHSGRNITRLLNEPSSPLD